jgi:RHH-type proline utilization regulon transcriptional repressor/proline dehydrogenase/delta 1-pyrroline-5-carboxylate dehydrogenase
VLSSGFDSAGQRCSALRVLCLQEDIAGRVLQMLKEAMQELCIGDPALLATDIGPVIDEEARDRLLAHIEAMRRRGRPVHQLPLPADCAQGCFVPPTLIEIESLAELTQEVFGPVVHVLRFAGDELPALVASINATGFGLTLGLHSRIDETVDLVTTRAHVGNIYVNRNMVGAVVGVQPFGGEGLSGTGPKAGGPLYVPLLAGCAEVLLSALPAMPGETNAVLQAYAGWAQKWGYRKLAGLCDTYAAQSLLGAMQVLPGPTGERNTLTFAPRGRLLCCARDVDALLDQLAAVLATGNTAALTDDALGREVHSLLPPVLSEHVALCTEGAFDGIAGVLLDRSDPLLRQRLAASDGPLLPVYRPAPGSGHYPLYRMLAERVVSINTTAAGGNTTLMTLGA